MGSKITTEMLIKAKESEGLIESIKWIPSDIVIRIPMAAVTIELIPWLLKNCFGIEKKKKPVQNNEQKNNQINNNANNIEVANNEIINNNEPSFKGSRQDKTPNNESSNSKELSFKGGKNNLNLLEKALKNILECTPLANFCAKLSKIPGGIIPAMITAGSVLTSSTYIGKTLTKKSLDKDNRTTLAINQGFCCIIPAIAAYTIENLIKKIEKKLEYRYSGLNQNIAARDLLQGNIKNGQDRLNKLSKCVKGFRSLKTMVLFTIIYRYLTPVLVTPLANKIGDKIAANKAAKKLA